MKKTKIKFRGLLIIIPLLTQFILSSIYTFYAVQDYYNYIEHAKSCPNLNPLVPLNSAFTYWIGGLSITYCKEFFFYMIFLGGILPCLYFIISHKKEKISSKTIYSTCFAVSGFFAFISLLINFVSILLFIPVIQPDSVYDIYFYVIKSNTFSDLFYSSPFIYELIYMIMISIFCGIIGCLEYGCYRFTGNHMIGFFLPDILLLLVHLIDKHFHFSNSISPIRYSQQAVVSIANIKIYIIEIGILFLLSILVTGISIMNKRKTNTLN